MWIEKESLYCFLHLERFLFGFLEKVFVVGKSRTQNAPGAVSTFSNVQVVDGAAYCVLNFVQFDPSRKAHRWVEQNVGHLGPCRAGGIAEIVTHALTQA